MNVEGAVQGSLFARDFLTESISQLSDWQAVDDAALDEFERALRGIFDRFPTDQTPNEGDKLPQFHACLYGVESENPFRPIIPDQVAFLGVLQVLFSAVMIFLFLLTVRNHFRIK